MKIPDIGTVIAERELDGSLDGNLVKVTVKIGKPFPDQNDGFCWYCPYCICTPKDEIIRSAVGVDSVQALRLAIFIIGAELDTIHAVLKLTWLGKNDLGFPKQS